MDVLLAEERITAEFWGEFSVKHFELEFFVFESDALEVLEVHLETLKKGLE